MKIKPARIAIAAVLLLSAACQSSTAPRIPPADDDDDERPGPGTSGPGGDAMLSPSMSGGAVVIYV